MHGLPGMDGIDEINESLGHDETQDEAHADHYGIGRGAHPARNKRKGRMELFRRFIQFGEYKCPYVRINLGGRSSAITTQMRVP